jgi:sulfur-carrier protein adenylyltransferase/sulfurtransferase
MAAMIVGALALLLLVDHGGGATISPGEAEAMIAGKDSILVLDVRTPGEYAGASGHIEGALLIPVHELGQRIAELEPYRGYTIVAYCRSGNRSGKAAATLTAQGFKAFNMSGGIVQWNEEKRPVKHGAER